MVYRLCTCGQIDIEHVDSTGKCRRCSCEKFKSQMLRNKYGATATVIDGIRFASKAEANYYVGLTVARKSGDLRFFLRQVPFDLPGGVRYLCDFVEFWKNGDMRFIDVKGHKTNEYILKKKQVEALYPVEITEVRK